jgi:hypothetical protein
MALTNPIEVVQSFHRAFRRDMNEIDDYVLSAARSGRDYTPILNRFRIFGDILDIHAQGEEAAVFPAFDKITPTIAKTYYMDHRELDSMVIGVKDALDSSEALKLNRATAVLNSHMRIHLNKEDEFLYPTLKKNFSTEEQGSIVGALSSKVPSDKAPVLVKWLFSLIGDDDRVLVTTVWKSMMPPQVFASIKPIIKETIAEDWVKLVNSVPDLEAL